MDHPTPDPPEELGTREGLAYALYLPEGVPKGGVVLLHGARSAKESHFDFGRMCRASGVAAVAYDARGYGGSEGVFGSGAVADALTMVGLLRERGAPEVALRGSSMGGCFSLLAAAADQSIAAVVAICPAPPGLLLRGLRAGMFEEPVSVDREAVEPWLETLDLETAVTALGHRTALLLMHARGDEQVPYTVSEELHAVAHEPKRLLLFPGGHHRSLQHDMEAQSVSLKWIEKAFTAGAAARGPG